MIMSGVSCSANVTMYRNHNMNISFVLRGVTNIMAVTLRLHGIDTFLRTMLRLVSPGKT
jgi:hypothetical protein